MFFRAAGFDVDDDNDPAPENIPGVEGETLTLSNLHYTDKERPTYKD
jgi:hypothetical protein